MGNATVVRQRACQIKMIQPLFQAKIRCLKKLLEQNDLRTVFGGEPDKIFGALDIVIDIAAARHLGRRNRQFPHLSLLQRLACSHEVFDCIHDGADNRIALHTVYDQRR